MFLTIKLCTPAIKMDLALSNLQRLICHKPKQTNKQTKPKSVFSVNNNQCLKINQC